MLAMAESGSGFVRWLMCSLSVFSYGTGGNARRNVTDCTIGEVKDGVPPGSVGVPLH